MKSIETQAQITGIRARVDGSLGLSVSTPELSPEEKVLFMNLQNLNVKMTVEPMDVQITEKSKIEKGMDGKSISERIYNVIYAYYKQINSKDEWEAFYKRHGEGIIDQYKEKLSKEN